jgi:serine/threonine protein kinase
VTKITDIIAKYIPRDIAIHEALRKAKAPYINFSIESYEETMGIGSKAEKVAVLILPYCNLGDMDKLVDHDAILTELETKYYLKCILTGLKSLHDLKYIHRDIKLQNILINNENGKTVPYLCDFGLSKLDHNGAKTVCGTKIYMAPEIYNAYLNGSPAIYDKSADIWSIGILAYRLLNGKMPYNSSTDISQMFKSQKFTLVKEVSLDAQSFLQCCLQTEKKYRKTVDELLSHPFIKDEKTYSYLVEGAQYICLEEKVNDYTYLDEYPRYEDYSTVKQSYGQEETPLNEGGYSKVYVIEDLKTGVKYIKRMTRITKGIYRYINNEVKVHKIFQKKRPAFINYMISYYVEKIEVKTALHQSNYQEEYFVMILPYCDSGDLNTHIENNGFLSENDAKRIISQVLQAIKFCHENNIMHTDIKTNNIILNKEGTEYVFYLCDFGSSKFESADPKTFLGTLYCAPPEVMQYLEKKQTPRFDKKADIWGIGVLLYQILVGANSFQTTHIQATKSIQIPLKRISLAALSFLECCLQFDPKNRSTVEELCLHPFIASNNYKHATWVTEELPARSINMQSHQYTDELKKIKYDSTSSDMMLNVFSYYFKNEMLYEFYFIFNYHAQLIHFPSKLLGPIKRIHSTTQIN